MGIRFVQSCRYTMANQLFNKTEKIQQAVSLINELDDSKFPLLLSRILQKLHLKEDIFTKDEESKLEVSLSVDQQQLKLILQTLTFFFERAVYHLSKPAVLSQQLKQLELTDEKVSVIVQAWVSNARIVTDRLKKQVITPNILTDVGWELRLQMAQSNLSKMRKPIGVVELNLSTDNGPKKIQMEFSHEELYSLYNQLEVIQSQLDALR